MKMKLVKLWIICIISVFLLSYLGTANTADVTKLYMKSLKSNPVVYNIRVFDDFIEPDTIEVKKGTSVEFFVTYSGNETTRFVVGDIDERLFKGKTVAVRFEADKKGSFEFGDFKRPLGELVVQ